jgi:penicillin amidase
MNARSALRLVLHAGLLLSVGCSDDSPPAASKPTAGTLAAKVTVHRDAQGVPHIIAGNRLDMLMAQGYETARDRLYYMEYMRRFTYGTRAEVWGEKFVDDDTVKRAIGFAKQATGMWVALQAKHPEIAKELTAFTAGVNAAMADMKAGKLSRPTEFDSMEPGWWPTTWREEDSIAMGRALVFSQNFGGDTELVIFAGKFLMGADTFAEVFRFQPLYPTYILEDEPTSAFGQQQGGLTPAGQAGSPPGPFWPAAREREVARGTPEQRRAVAAAIAQLAQLLAQAVGKDSPSDTTGSNSWVVHKDLTGGTGAIMCNDPHMALDLPSRLYAMHLVDKSVDDSGAFGHTLPGVPWLTFGHNQHVAWALTNSFVDTTDLYQEVLCQDGAGVQFQGQCVPIVSREEVIRVRQLGKPLAEATSLTRTVREVPHHGPILNDLVPKQVGDALTGVGMLFSARWAGFGNTEEPVALSKMLTVKSVDEAMDALKFFNGGVLNWSFADRHGDIAYAAAGAYPKRAKPATEQPPWDPLPGEGPGEWLGLEDWDYVPKVKNPKKGFIVTANNQQLGNGNDNNLANDAKYLGHFWDIGTRAFRITEQLQKLAKAGPVTLEQMGQLQVDDHAVLADALVPKLLAQETAVCADQTKALACQALGVLKSWDRKQGVDSAGAAIFGTWINHALFETFNDEIPDLIKPLVNGFLVAIGARSMGAWLAPDFAGSTSWDDGATTAKETADDIYLRALDTAVAQLAARYPGQAPASYKWGDLHQVRFTHGGFPDLSIGPMPRAGGHRTINAADYRPLGPDNLPAPYPYLMTEGAVFRVCVQFQAGGPVGFHSLAGGQSSDSASDYFDSQIADWVAGKTAPIALTTAAAKAAAVKTWTLPKGLTAPQP